MWRFVAVVIFTLSLTTETFSKLGAPGGPLQLERQDVDTFKVFTNFQFPVVISDANNDKIFECVKANRTEIDPEARTATYVWMFAETEKGPKHDIPFRVKVADAPNTQTFTLGDDPTHKEGIIYYTDYETCVVLDMEYQGHHCALWVTLAYKDDAPKECIEHFEDTCGVAVEPHRRDLCEDGEGDY
ncbi:uncharacterized protein LOC144151730 [Haemaphysalis longicornis]